MFPRFLVNVDSNHKPHSEFAEYILQWRHAMVLAPILLGVTDAAACEAHLDVQSRLEHFTRNSGQPHCFCTACAVTFALVFDTLSRFGTPFALWVGPLFSLCSCSRRRGRRHAVCIVGAFLTLLLPAETLMKGVIRRVRTTDKFI